MWHPLMTVVENWRKARVILSDLHRKSATRALGVSGSTPFHAICSGAPGRNCGRPKLEATGEGAANLVCWWRRSPGKTAAVWSMQEVAAGSTVSSVCSGPQFMRDCIPTRICIPTHAFDFLLHMDAFDEFSDASLNDAKNSQIRHFFKALPERAK